MNPVESPQIVSVSRRTDIPAFFAKEFRDWLKASVVEVRSPFGGKKYQVNLQPEAVACFVFWSKNFRPFFPVLDDLERRGDGLYFLFTITGLARGLTKPLEPGVPDPIDAIKTLIELSERYSPRQVAWRFDPIIFSNMTPVSFWLENFQEFGERLHSHVHRCIFSFCDYYRKVIRRLDNAEFSGWDFREGTFDEKLELIQGMQTLAQQWNLRLATCCEDQWVIGDIKKGSCVDAPYLAQVFPNKKIPQRHHPTRKECGCWESRDIGTYATCHAQCPYCYAL
jgi:hypothetical protein